MKQKTYNHEVYRWQTKDGGLQKYKGPRPL